MVHRLLFILLFVGVVACSQFQTHQSEELQLVNINTNISECYSFYHKTADKCHLHLLSFVTDLC